MSKYCKKSAFPDFFLPTFCSFSPKLFLNLNFENLKNLKNHKNPRKTVKSVEKPGNKLGLGNMSLWSVWVIVFFLTRMRPRFFAHASFCSTLPFFIFRAQGSRNTISPKSFGVRGSTPNTQILDLGNHDPLFRTLDHWFSEVRLRRGPRSNPRSAKDLQISLNNLRFYPGGFESNLLVSTNLIVFSQNFFDSTKLYLTPLESIGELFWSVDSSEVDFFRDFLLLKLFFGVRMLSTTLHFWSQ